MSDHRTKPLLINGSDLLEHNDGIIGYSTRTVVSVKGGNINMDAIKELTNRSDVTSVHISALLVPLPDDVVDEPAVDG